MFIPQLKKITNFLICLIMYVVIRETDGRAVLFLAVEIEQVS